MKAVKSFLKQVALFGSTYRLTLLVWSGIIVAACALTVYDGLQSRAILANLNSSNQSVKSAEVVDLARAGKLSTVLIGTEDPTQEVTSSINVQSAALRLACADLLVNNISQLTPDQAFSTLYSLQKDTVTAPDAVTGLTKLGLQNPRNLSTLGTGLADADPDVRTAAQGALSAIGGASVVDLAAAQVKVDIAQDSALATLTAVGVPSIHVLSDIVLEGSNPELLREKAAADLGVIGSPIGSNALEMGASQTPANPQLRRVCLTSLASIVLATVPVEGAPASPATPVASSSQIESARAEAPLLISSVLNNDDDGFARSREAIALGRLATPAAVAALVQTLSSLDLRLAAAAQAGVESVGEPAVPQLGKVIHDENPQVRVAAALALGIIGTDVALHYVTPALNDPEAQVRRSAAIGLGRSANVEAVPLLTVHLGDSDGSVAAAASNSLHELGPQAIGSLITAMRSVGGANTTAFFASQALSSDGEQAIPLLARASKHGSDQQKVWIAVTLGAMHDPHAIGVLQELESDRSSRVKWAAGQALEQYQGQS